MDFVISIVAFFLTILGVLLLGAIFFPVALSIGEWICLRFQKLVGWRQ